MFWLYIRKADLPDQGVRAHDVALASPTCAAPAAFSVSAPAGVANAAVLPPGAALRLLNVRTPHRGHTYQTGTKSAVVTRAATTAPEELQRSRDEEESRALHFQVVLLLVLLLRELRLEVLLQAPQQRLLQELLLIVLKELLPCRNSRKGA